jgi:hypothetical protein
MLRFPTYSSRSFVQCPVTSAHITPTIFFVGATCIFWMPGSPLRVAGYFPELPLRKHPTESSCAYLECHLPKKRRKAPAFRYGDIRRILVFLAHLCSPSSIRFGVKCELELNRRQVCRTRLLKNWIWRWGRQATPVNSNRHERETLSGLDESRSRNVVPLLVSVRRPVSASVRQKPPPSGVGSVTLLRQRGFPQATG